jgi:uncharacterized membrane protein
MAGTGNASTRSHPGRGVSAGMRIAVSALVGAAAGLVAILLGSALIAPAVGWDAGAVTFLVWTWLIIGPMSAHDTAAHATREDPSRPVSDVLLLAAAVVSLAAVGIVLVQASSAQGAAQDLLAGVGVATVALSWLVVHTVYTLQYARLYYSDSPGGVDFNQTIPPRYADFAYLSLTLGMTFQVSDTDLQEPTIRAAALRQALLSYLFGVVIVATTINLIASLGSGRGGGP